MTEDKRRFSWFGTRPSNDYETHWRRCRRCNSAKAIAGFFGHERLGGKRRYVCWSCVGHEVPVTELLMVLVP